MQNVQNAVLTHPTTEKTNFYPGTLSDDPIIEPQHNPDVYLIYPEDDGTDGTKNAYSMV
jgi:hypothetical protein